MLAFAPARLSQRSAAGLLRRRLPSLAAVLYLAAVTVILFSLFSTRSYDDPYITFRYAYNLARGAGFVYNPGEQVLGTTTVFFTLLLAGSSRLFALPAEALPPTANLVGAFCMAWGGLLLWELAHRWKAPTAGWVCLLLYPTTPILASSLGSEMPLYIALCLAAITAYVRKQLTLSAGFAALAVLTRPDGMLLALVLTVHSVVWQSQTPPWRAVGVFAALTLPWFLFAWAYFGSPIPVTLAAKQIQGSMTISQKFLPGLVEWVAALLRRPTFAAQAALAGVGAIYHARHYRSGNSEASLKPALGGFSLLWGWLAAYVLAFTLLGVSRYYWYYTPLAAGWVAAVGLGVAAVAGGPNQPGAPAKPGVRLRPLLAVVLAVGVVTGQAAELARLARTPDRRMQAYHQAAAWLKANTPAQASVGALEIGVIGYGSERRVVDFAGLVQPETARFLQGAGSYEDAAISAAERYQPDFVVLREDLFPRLKAGYLDQSCRQVHEIPASSGYPWSLRIYECR